jgi:integrase
MATITPSLSTKIDDNKRQQIYIRLSVGRGNVFRIQTQIYVSKYWLSTGKKEFLKRIDSNPEAAEAYDKYKKLCNFIEEEIKQIKAIGDETQFTKQWANSLIIHYEQADQTSANEKEGETKPTSLLVLMEDFIACAPQRIQKVGTHKGDGIGEKTVVQYKQTVNLIKDFLKDKRKKDLELPDVNEVFYNSFVDFLGNKRGYAKNTIGKHIKNIKAAINTLPLEIRSKCEFIEPRKCVKLSEDIENIYLNEEQLQAIADADLHANYLDRIRDEFLLLAWTGCRYSDLGKLSKENILKGGKYFKFEQTKTKAKVVIPILPEAMRILEKYNYEMPTPMANQKFNEYLKEVCKAAGLTDEVKIERTIGGKKQGESKPMYMCVTAHTARRSFATNLYKRGLPSLAIMAVTGHKTEKAFLTYIKIRGEENASRMLEAFLATQK